MTSYKLMTIDVGKYFLYSNNKKSSIELIKIPVKETCPDILFLQNVAIESYRQLKTYFKNDIGVSIYDGIIKEGKNAILWKKEKFLYDVGNKWRSEPRDPVLRSNSIMVRLQPIQKGKTILFSSYHGTADDIDLGDKQDLFNSFVDYLAEFKMPTIISGGFDVSYKRMSSNIFRISRIRGNKKDYFLSTRNIVVKCDLVPDKPGVVKPNKSDAIVATLIAK